MVEEYMYKVEFYKIFSFKRGRKMAKNKKVWQNEIRDLYLNHQGKLNAAEAQKQLKKMPIQMPTHINTIQKYMHNNKPAWDELLNKGLDYPWSVGALTTHPYLKEVLPLLLMLKNEYFSNIPERLTIRWALWFLTLRKIYPGPLKQDTKKLSQKLIEKRVLKYQGDMIILTSFYVDYERQWQLAGGVLPANTSQFDDMDINKAIEKFLAWYKADLDPDNYESLLKVGNEYYAGIEDKDIK